MQLSTSGSSFLLTCYIGYWCPYHYGCEDCPQIGCSNLWYPWLHIDFNVCLPNVRLYPLTWPSSNLVIKLDDQFQLLVAELWQLWGKYNRSIPYQSSMWLIVPVKCPSVAIRFHNKGGSRRRSVSSHRYVFFSYCTNFLNNYRYLYNTRGWQTTRTIRPPIPAPHHVTTTGTPPSSTCRLPPLALRESVEYYQSIFHSTLSAVAAQLLWSFLSTRPRNRTLKLSWIIFMFGMDLDYILSFFCLVLFPLYDYD